MQMVWKEGGRGPPQGWEPQVFEESDDDDVAMVICPQGRPAGGRARRCRARGLTAISTVAMRFTGISITSPVSAWCTVMR